MDINPNINPNVNPDPDRRMNPMDPPPPPPPQPAVYGPFWEHRDQVGVFRALFRTIGDVIKEPSASFRTMRRDGGVGGPLLFALVVGCPVHAVSMFYQVAGNSMVGALGKMVGDQGAMTHAGMSGFAAIVFVLLSPLLLTVAMFVGAAINHVCLMLVGGANGDFEVTFRVACYATSVSVIGLVPCCGGVVAPIWQIVVLIIGLQQAHQTTTGKAVLAVFLPAITCCVVVGVLMGIPLTLAMLNA